MPTPEGAPLSEAQRNELDWRIADMDLAGCSGSSWEDVEVRIRARLKAARLVRGEAGSACDAASSLRSKR